MRTPIPTLVLLLILVVPARAQEFGPALGELYLSFEPDSRVLVMDHPAFEQFQFHVLAAIDWGDAGLAAHNGFNGIRGWEASVQVPAELTVVGREVRPASSIDIANGADNYVVGTGQLVDAWAAPVSLVVYTAFLASPDLTDLVVTLGASSPTSFDVPGGPGAVPGWLEFHRSGQCGENRCLRSFAESSGRLVINCRSESECRVATVRRSWGALKASY